MICQNDTLILSVDGALDVNTQGPACTRKATHRTIEWPIILLCASHARGYDKIASTLGQSDRTERIK